MKVYFETLGCPKNVNDSQVASGILEKNGIEVVNDIENADTLIVNTCGFINDAKVESINKILELSNYSDKTLVVSGCLSQRYSEELYKEIPEVDIFIGVNDYENLPEILKNHKNNNRDKIIHEYSNEMKEEVDFRKIPENPYSTTIKIAEGCNNMCTFCAIPKIRGPFRSRTMEDILKEAKLLANAGTKELTLIAQDVAAYGIDLYGKYSLATLLKELCKIDGLKWIRLLYCYEEKITDELISVMASEEKICNYIDIPIQHSSDSLLASMRRKSTRTSLVSTISKLRKAMPDISIRTTLITGFPGETEEDFDDLYDFVNEIEFERLGVFTYSQEEGTEAALSDNQIDEDLKVQRKDSIMRRQIDISLEKNKKFIGKEVLVLIDEIEKDDVYIGRTMYDAPEIDNSVIVTSSKEHKVGDFIKVLINDAFDYDLVGTEV